ncbi:MAG: glycoside hydrolase family 97 catalytic domain-containing protein [Prevotella sp.]|nr:glycoside hydrolase family 97 catalytic domain-containing protein [Prevotella sp.]
MKQLILTIVLFSVALAINAQKVASPNGKLSAKINGKSLVINYDKQKVIELADISFDKLRFTRQVKDDYQMLEGKRLHCTNEANEYQAPIGSNAKIVIRLYNDGVAFRYEYIKLENQKQPEEHTVYLIPEGTKRWFMQWTEAYEGFFPQTTTYKVKPIRTSSGVSTSADGWNNRWGYPALLEPAEGVFALISEANVERRQSASCLYNDGERYSVVAAENDLNLSGDWHTPWRVVIIGKLADIVESTLVTDVSEPSQLKDTNWIKPGVVSWIYWANNHGSNDYNIIKKYVDMAVVLKLPYVLIDAEWDEMDKIASNEGKTIEDAVAYANAKGIKPMIWYNSSVGWIDGAPGPKFRLNKPEDREKEFAWCEKIGVAGVKINFFSGDNQMNMDYCLDLLESAARHHLLVNFHGAPIPRGWQKTWPNLLSTEGVYGAEWYNNVPTFTDKAASHNTTLPFTRNVIGPMDYTPCAFSDSQHPHITSLAHELALTVLYESGLQHLADRPESFLAQPKEVQDFLGQLPTVWDETRYVSGYPGESAVLARRSGNTWYVAGINGKDAPQILKTNLSFMGKGSVQMFVDDASGKWQISTISKLPSQVECQPRGGFVMKIIL